MRSQPICIHQYHYSASGADAVTNQMRLIQRSLATANIRGRLFAHHLQPSAAGLVERFDSGQFWDCDLVLLHHSHGNPKLQDVLKLEVPKALIYHNVTPAKYFRHDPHIAALCRQGRQQLDTLQTHTIQAFGDSSYNCAELKLHGFGDVEVFPLLDLSAAASLADTPPKPRNAIGTQRTVLFVGKLTPHKNQALLLHVLFYLRRMENRDYRLKLVGRADPLYREYLKSLAEGLGVEHQVEFLGAVDDARLGQLYEAADAFVCVSLHEGFCVPLVEAMSHGVPVFAFARSGIRETLGKSAVRFTSEQPHKIAEAVETVLNSAEAVSAVCRSQYLQLEQLSTVHNAQRIVEQCTRLIDRLRSRVPGNEAPEIYL